MTYLYTATPEEVTALEQLMEYVGTHTLPYLPSRFWWIENALKDAKACDFRKKAAKLTGHAMSIRFVPELEHLVGEVCECGREADIGNGECTACHTGLSLVLEEEVFYTCRHCGDEEVRVFHDCSCLTEDKSHTEGPFGGAFRDQEDYEQYRFGGISYLNSLKF